MGIIKIIKLRFLNINGFKFKAGKYWKNEKNGKAKRQSKR